jgi:sugar O-acyltransferase (sialic acid O-acetyltransferase NeuD family)
MNTQSARDRPVVLIGAGGHAKVLLDLLRACGRAVAGVCDPDLHARGETEWRGLRVLGDDGALDHFRAERTALVNGVGQRVGHDLRRHVYERLRRAGFHFPVLVHPAAWVSPTARLAEGVQVMAGAIVQSDVAVGENTIVNTRASIDHDCDVGRHAHISPAATLCGSVCVEEGAFIGAGSTVIQGLRVGAGAVLGAGTTLTRNLAAGAIRTGAPSRARNGTQASRREEQP